MTDFLYRGVSLAMHNTNNGRIAPRACGPFTYNFKWDEPGFGWDSGATWDDSIENAIHRHQLGQAGFPTSGVSTTPHFDRAILYALSGDPSKKDVVYRFSVARLRDLAIQMCRVADVSTPPSVPEDDEVILIAADRAELPPDSISEVIRVGTA